MAINVKYLIFDFKRSCLCIGYLIPYKDVLGKKIIVNELENNKCIAKEIDLEVTNEYM